MRIKLISALFLILLCSLASGTPSEVITHCLTNEVGRMAEFRSHFCSTNPEYGGSGKQVSMDDEVVKNAYREYREANLLDSERIFYGKAYRKVSYLVEDHPYFCTDGVLIAAAASCWALHRYWPAFRKKVSDPLIKRSQEYVTSLKESAKTRWYSLGVAAGVAVLGTALCKRASIKKALGF